MTGRDAAIARFLALQGWAGARRTALAGDASFRRYFRLVEGERRAVLMDAPPHLLDLGPFIAIDAHLRALGYSAPAILAADREAGLLLLEDLGDDSFTALIARGSDPYALYGLAIDLLIDLHRRGVAALPPGLPPYDDAKLLEEVGRFALWYVPEMLGGPLPEAAAKSYEALWRALLPVARGVPEGFVYRDFFSDNLMLLPRPGLAACGLIDFQDAVAGPVTYDPVSLLEDARRDLPSDLVAAMRARYLAAFPEIDRSAFAASWAVMAAQRHIKCIGLFTRLCRRDGKPGYLQHIPRLWRLVDAAAAHPALAPLRQWLDASLPADRRGVPAP